MGAAHDRAAQVDGIATGISRRVLALWALVDPDDIRGSWAALSADAQTLVSLGQLATAATADGYLDAAWRESHGATPKASGRVLARSLAGIASDGRSLATLLQQPAIGALSLIASGQKPADALVAQAPRVAVIAGTQVSDAGRAAESVALTARPQIGGYVRALTPPSCSRCAVLAGAWYEWNEGFRRHPRCDCVHRPAARTDGGRTQPRAYFDSLTGEQQDRIFGKADAEAIRGGADVIATVNARQRGTVAAAAPPTPAPAAGTRSAERAAEVTHQLTVLQGQLAQGGGTDWTRSRVTVLAEELAEIRSDPQVMPGQIIAASASRVDAIEQLTRRGYLAA